MADKTRILIFTGDGKGKTTAAMGMALRSCGHGLKTLIIQFIKNDLRTGELAAIEKLDGVDFYQSGAGFVLPRDKSTAKYQRHLAAAEKAMQCAKSAIASGKYALVILDEICGAIATELINENDVLSLLEPATSGITIVMTGRDAPQSLINIADTVTEMKCIKHGFDDGIPAQKGVEI